MQAIFISRSSFIQQCMMQVTNVLTKEEKTAYSLEQVEFRDKTEIMQSKTN